MALSIFTLLYNRHHCLPAEPCHLPHPLIISPHSLLCPWNVLVYFLSLWIWLFSVSVYVFSMLKFFLREGKNTAGLMEMHVRTLQGLPKFLLSHFAPAFRVHIVGMESGHMISQVLELCFECVPRECLLNGSMSLWKQWATHYHPKTLTSLYLWLNSDFCICDPVGNWHLPITDLERTAG